MSAGKISLNRIKATRRILRKAAAACGERGAITEELAIAASYAALDMAQHEAGAGIAAIEWLRTFCDMVERVVMADANRPSE